MIFLYTYSGFTQSGGIYLCLLRFIYHLGPLGGTTLDSPPRHRLLLLAWPGPPTSWWGSSGHRGGRQVEEPLVIYIYILYGLYIHTCMHACIQTYIHTYTHTYIYIYIGYGHMILRQNRSLISCIVLFWFVFGHLDGKIHQTTVTTDWCTKDAMTELRLAANQRESWHPTRPGTGGITEPLRENLHGTIVFNQHQGSGFRQIFP